MSNTWEDALITFLSLRSSVVKQESYLHLRVVSLCEHKMFKILKTISDSRQPINVTIID